MKKLLILTLLLLTGSQFLIAAPPNKLVSNRLRSGSSAVCGAGYLSVVINNNPADLLVKTYPEIFGNYSPNPSPVTSNFVTCMPTNPELAITPLSKNGPWNYDITTDANYTAGKYPSHLTIPSLDSSTASVYPWIHAAIGDVCEINNTTGTWTKEPAQYNLPQEVDYYCKPNANIQSKK